LLLTIFILLRSESNALKLRCGFHPRSETAMQATTYGLPSSYRRFGPLIVSLYQALNTNAGLPAPTGKCTLGSSYLPSVKHKR